MADTACHFLKWQFVPVNIHRSGNRYPHFFSNFLSRRNPVVSLTFCAVNLTRSNRRSPWDTLHPGRKWAAEPRDNCHHNRRHDIREQNQPGCRSRGTNTATMQVRRWRGASSFIARAGKRCWPSFHRRFARNFLNSACCNYWLCHCVHSCFRKNTSGHTGLRQT